MDTNQKIVVGILAAVVVLTGVAMWGMPQYNVWQQGLAGEAAFRRAEQDRKIAIEEAKAKMEAAKSLAGAEVERARGVAEANQIIAEGLGGPDGYLRWLWVNNLAETKGQIIYIPTEANLPILEATRLPPR